MSVLSFFVTFLLGLLPVGVSDIVYRLKWLLSRTFVRTSKYFKKSRLGFYDLSTQGQPERVGFIAHPTEIKLESPFPDSHLAKAEDKIFCYGINSKSECLIVSIARFCNQKAESFVHLKLSNGKMYQLEYNSDLQQTTSETNAFSCGGLQMHYLRPMKTWRIFFNGFLQETTEGDDDYRMVYVKFSLLWRASSDVYESTSDLSESAIAKSLAKEDWKNGTPPLSKLNSVLDFYAQAGVILGTVCIDDTVDDYELYLFGERIRYLGDQTVSEEIEFSNMLGYVHKNGAFVHFGEASIKNVARKIQFGFIVKPKGELDKIEGADISLNDFGRKISVTEINGTLEAERSYALASSLLQPIIQASSNEKTFTIHHLNIYLNGKKGTGFLIKGKYNLSSHRDVFDITPPAKVPESLVPLVVTFNETLCQLPEITGGKGSSLGKLTHLSQQLQKFVVPSGFVVTTSSYKEFINKDILLEIKKLENVLYGNTAGDPRSVSKRVSDQVIAAEIPSHVQDNIVKNLEKIFGEKFMLKKFAVRSSATGEDTEQMSAAGQMDTFLGISGLENILLAVKKCWASQFGFTAIQYKRRYGQCLNTPMAVVIQEMVACETAGVIFTCNPVTGNPTTISIAANFGLGESVVSASEEPDTIELGRDASNNLSLHKVIIGSKSHKIIVKDGGTGEEDIPEHERQECCLSEENALQLGEMAIRIEEYFRSRRDIEWGMVNDITYIFQSRPVTSGTQETDFEIEHEFDSALRVENEYTSVSHSGEVLPGAMSPLGMELFFKTFSIAWQKYCDVSWQQISGVKSRYFLTSWLPMYNHIVFNVADLFREDKSKNISNYEKSTMIAFFGRVIDLEEAFEVARERYGDEPRKASFKDMWHRVKCLFLYGRQLRKWQKFYSDYRVPVEKYKTSKELYNDLIKRCCDFNPAIFNHMACSMASIMWNMAILSTLSSSKEEADNDVYADFSKLITTKSNVESADVPSAIQALAHDIAKSIEPQVFKAMKVEEALKWLTTTSSSAGRKFKELIRKHGHRCLMEFDVFVCPWGEDPRSLVQLVQNMVGTVSKGGGHKNTSSLMKLISELKVRIGLLSKLKLMFLIPMCQKSVQEREATKSMLIRGIDAWRKGYRGMAKLMVSEGRIPNEEILFFMTPEEIQELLDSRSPKILAKAYHRQRLFPKMYKYMFPEVMRGFPRPLGDSDKDTGAMEGYFSMKGIPVSQGIAKGYVRVAISLDEAADLKAGEILVTYGTDIGWSPYFPTLAGVATELGGLISHGAVVSREYGLPCIVGLHGATRQFVTGDYVLLDGNKGILQKLPPPECS